MRGRDRGEPVEQALLACYFRKQHHPEQEQIDVGAPADAGDRLGHGDQPRHEEKRGARHGPYRFCKIEGPENDACRGKRGDQPDHRG